MASANADFRLQGVGAAKIPSRATGPVIAGDSGASLEPSDSVASARPQAETQPAFPTQTGLAAAALGGLGWQSMSTSLGVGYGMGFMPFVPAFLRRNEDSGVSESMQAGFMMGSQRTYALPDGTQLSRITGPSAFTPGIPMDFVTAHRHQVDSGTTQLVPLPARLNPNGTMQFTNPDGTMTLLDPHDLSLSRLEPGSDKPPTQRQGLIDTQRHLQAGNDVLLEGPGALDLSRDLVATTSGAHLGSASKPEDLFGRWAPGGGNQGEAKFYPTMLAESAARGGTVGLHFYSAPDESTQAFLAHVLEHRECPPSYRADGQEIPIPPEERFKVHPETRFLATGVAGLELAPELRARFETVSLGPPSPEDLAFTADKLAPHLNPQQRLGLSSFHHEAQSLAGPGTEESSLLQFEYCLRTADAYAAEGDERAVGKAVEYAYLRAGLGQDATRLRELGQTYLGKSQLPD